MVVEVLWCAYSPRRGVEDGCCDLNWWLMVAVCQSSSRFRKSIVLSSLVLLYCTSPFRIIVADRSCAALCSKKRSTLWIDMLCFRFPLSILYTPAQSTQQSAVACKCRSLKVSQYVLLLRTVCHPAAGTLPFSVSPASGPNILSPLLSTLPCRTHACCPSPGRIRCRNTR
jgi:hypothetical protein